MKQQTKFHFLTFFTNGPSIDNGANLVCQKETLLKLIPKEFHTKTAYCPSELIKLDSKWVECFEDKRNYMHSEWLNSTKDFVYNKNWAALNFLLWKPMLINHVLECDPRISDGDVLFYHDVDVHKYPDYLKGIDDWGSYISEKIKGRSVLLFNDNDKKIDNDVKYEMLKKYFEDIKQAKKLHHVWAGAIAIKKDEYGLAFTKRWEELTNDLDNRSQLTNYGKIKGFHWHSQEQACLSVLYHCENTSLNVQCEFLNGYRSIPPQKFSKLFWLLQKYLPITFKIIHKLNQILRDTLKKIQCQT